MEVFPIKVGPVTSAQFMQRFEPGVHDGTDIFAPAGAGVVAVADGTIRHAESERGGKVVYLEEDDGTRWYYAHLDAWADPMRPDKRRKVEAGDLLGYVGTSGNARGRAPHVHLEWRPGGGEKADPFPELTRTFAAVETRMATTPKKKRRKRKKPQGGRPPEVMPGAPAGWGLGLGLLLLAAAASRKDGDSWL